MKPHLLPVCLLITVLWNSMDPSRWLPLNGTLGLGRVDRALLAPSRLPQTQNNYFKIWYEISSSVLGQPDDPLWVLGWPPISISCDWCWLRTEPPLQYRQWVAYFTCFLALNPQYPGALSHELVIGLTGSHSSFPSSSSTSPIASIAWSKSKQFLLFYPWFFF